MGANLLDDDIQIVAVNTPQQSITPNNNDPTELTVTACNKTVLPPASSPDTVTSVEVAGENINGDRVVFADDSNVFLADTNLKQNVIGVSVTGGLTGSAITVRNFGVIINPTWTWTPRASLFFDSIGQLTHTPPSSGFILKVAHAVTATKIFVNIQQAIRRV